MLFLRHFHYAILDAYYRNGGYRHEHAADNDRR
jgi:hypothetical protein